MSTCFITIFSSTAVVSAKTDMCSILRYRQFKDKKKFHIFAKKEVYYCRGKKMFLTLIKILILVLLLRKTLITHFLPSWKIITLHGWDILYLLDTKCKTEIVSQYVIALYNQCSSPNIHEPLGCFIA